MVDEMPDEAVEALANLILECSFGRVAQVLAKAPLDDEPYTLEEQAEDRTSMSEPSIPWKKIKAEFFFDV